MPDIVITSNRGTSSNPKIDFTGVTTGTIKLEVLADGTIAWNGANGSLFSIADSLSGSLMSVNDVSGLPAFEVFSDNRVVVGQFGANLLLGKTTNSSNGRLQFPVSTLISGGIAFGAASLYTASNNSLDFASGVTSAAFILRNSGTGIAAFQVDTNNAYLDSQRTGGGLVFRTNGTTTALTLDSSQNATFASRITANGATIASAGSIQVTSADAALRLKSTTSPVADKNTWDIRSVGNGATPYLQFRTVNDANTVFTDRVAFTNDGNVGIGTASPTTLLHTRTVANTDNELRVDVLSGANKSILGLANNGTDYGQLYFDNAINAVILNQRYSSGYLGLGANSRTTDLVILASTGNVGIGTTSPGARFEVRKTDGGNAFRFANYVDGGALGSWVGTYGAEFRTVTSGSVSHGMLINNNEANDARRTLDISDSNGVFATFTNGKFGIGTTSPSQKLDVSSTTAGAQNISITKANSGTGNQNSGNLYFDNYAPTDLARNPNVELGSIYFRSSQPTSGAIQNSARIQAIADGTQSGVNTQAALTFAVVPSGSTLVEAMRINSGGTVQTAGSVVIGGNFANNSYNSVASTKLLFGGGNDPAAYYIGTNLNNYGGNYTKLDLAWHTGIRLGAQPGYGGVRFFSSETLATQIFSVGETDGNVRVTNNLYSPIYYDSANTAYYVDPASTSNLNILNIGDGNLELYKSVSVDMSNVAIYSVSNYYPVTINVGTEGCIIQIQNNLNTNVPSWSTHGSGFTLNLRWRTNGSGWGTTEVRRYIEQYHERFANQTICGGITQMTNNSTEVVWLRGGGLYSFKVSRDLSPTPRSTAYTVSGQTVTPTSAAQNTIWNSATGTSFLYTEILYDYNNSAYYCDPAGTSIVNRIIARASGVSLSTGNSSQLEISNAASGACNISFHRESSYGAHFGLDTDNVFSTLGWSAGAGYTGMRVGSFTANGTIASTGAATFAGAVTVGGKITSAVSTATGYNQLYDTTGLTTGRGAFAITSTGAGLAFGVESSVGGTSFTGSTAYASYFGTTTATPIHFVTNSVIRQTIDSTGAATFAGNLSITGERFRVTNESTVLDVSTTTAAGGFVRSYSNKVSILNAAGAAQGVFSSTGLAVTGAVSGARGVFSDSSGSGAAIIEAYSTVATNGTTAIIRQTTGGGNGNQDIGLLVDIQGAADTDRIANFRYYNGSTYTSRMAIMRGGNVGIGTTSPSQKLDVQGTAYASSDFRAPIFYDSNSTAYYVDPAGTSVVHQIDLGGFLRRTTAAAGYLEGNYPISTNANNSSAIYTIGGSYQPAATTLGNMYGCGYTVGNGTANPGLGSAGWGFYVASGGVSRIFLDSDYGNGTASNSWKAPIFYDSADTNYYLDPASTSNLNAATFAGNVSLTNGFIYSKQDQAHRWTSNGTSSGTIRGDIYTDSTGVMVLRTGATPTAALTLGAAQAATFAGAVATGNLTVTGAITATGNITAYFSDDRLKTRLGPISDPIAKIKALTGFYFEPNQTAQSLGYEKKTDVGVSAQEVQAILPEIIAPAPIDAQYMTVRYEKLIPLLIEAIKAQQVQIEELKAHITIIQQNLNNK